MDKYEVNKQLEKVSELLDILNKKNDLKKFEAEIGELEKKTMVENFWNDQEKAQSVLKELNHKKEIFSTLKKANDDFNALSEILDIAEDTELLDIYNELLRIDEVLFELKLKTSLSGKYDDYSAIVEIHAGSGGTEAQDWANMLFRMYQRYAEKAFTKINVLDIQQGNEVGIKSVIFTIDKEYAYGYLKGESGVHRLVRISPFDSNKRRHTSFASVLVMPKVDNEIDVKIDDKDLKIEAHHSSGAGGQSVNTTLSAVRITHIPTGIVVTCQNERSQIQNKQVALEILMSKLIQIELEKQQEEEKKLKGDIKKIEWGSQIRSYVFQPYQMVKDHRTNYEEGNINSVMDGEIQGFINNYLSEN